MTIVSNDRTILIFVWVDEFINTVEYGFPAKIRVDFICFSGDIAFDHCNIFSIQYWCQILLIRRTKKLDLLLRAEIYLNEWLLTKINVSSSANYLRHQIYVKRSFLVNIWHAYDENCCKSMEYWRGNLFSPLLCSRRLYRMTENDLLS